MDPIRLADPGDPRLAPFRALRDADVAREHGLFIVEGRLGVLSLLERSNFPAHSIALLPKAWEAMRGAIERLDRPGVPIYLLEPAVMDRLVGFELHRGCLGAAWRPAVATEASALLARIGEETPIDRPLLALEDLSNHDNVGGLFRSAAAFGCAGVLLSGRTCDPLYRKAVRVSMGSVLRMPFGRVREWPGGLGALVAAHGLEPVALSTDRDGVRVDALAGIAADARARGRRLVLLLGGEGPGLSAGALRLASHRVRIPTTDAVDSLNVGIAGAIALQRLGASLL